MAAPSAPRHRLRRVLIGTGITLALGLLAAAALAMTGALPAGDETAHPPCEELPGAAAVEEAITAHRDLVAELTAQGENVEVRAASPGCDDPDRTLVEVTYRTEDERAGIEAVLTEAEGFGVPVYVHES